MTRMSWNARTAARRMDDLMSFRLECVAIREDCAAQRPCVAIRLSTLGSGQHFPAWQSTPCSAPIRAFGRVRTAKRRGINADL